MLLARLLQSPLAEMRARNHTKREGGDMKKTTILMIAVPMLMACGHARIPVEFTPYETISRQSKDKDHVIQIIGKS